MPVDSRHSRRGKAEGKKVGRLGIRLKEEKKRLKGMRGKAEGTN
jgi:hypothetical protein